MQKKPKILIADDDESILFAFTTLFRNDNYPGIIARDGEEALEKASTEEPDIVFMDITMPRLDGLEALKELKQRYPALPVIIITGVGTMQTAVKAIQFGAFDYLTKPLEIGKIREVIRRAYLSSQTSPVPAEKTMHYDADILERYEIIGNTPQMQDVFKMIGAISTTPNYTPVLIIGESGTGKELVARAIHNNGQNSQEPFIAINCTAIPETLLESELFGYEKGAFTGAADRKVGRFEAAKCGTIFLDEISNLSLNLQQKLLRVLQQREFERVGGLETIPVNARFIAATNTAIASEVKKGNFREDLFYRLNIAVVYLSPLRERKDDLPALANYFLAKYNFHLKKQVKGFSDHAMKLLTGYDYPGNVRELENIIERAVMLAKGDVILSEHLSEITYPSVEKTYSVPIISDSFSESRDHVLQLFEKEFVRTLLSKTHGNVSRASQLSGMTRQNFQRLMKKYELRSEDFRN